MVWENIFRAPTHPNGWRWGFQSKIRLCFDFLGDSKTWRASKLYYRFKSYSKSVEWVDFACGLSFSGVGSASAACAAGLSYWGCHYVHPCHEHSLLYISLTRKVNVFDAINWEKGLWHLRQCFRISVLKFVFGSMKCIIYPQRYKQKRTSSFGKQGII